MIARPTPFTSPTLAVALRLVFCVVLSGCMAHAPYNYKREHELTKTYSVGPGDVLQVRAWKNEALSQRVVVRPDGYITLPLIGDVLAGGRTGEEIASDIAGRSSKFYTELPVVAVEVAELHSYRVYVLGEVARPGEFTPRAQVNVLQVIALAGGFTRFAAPNKIIIVRRDGQGERRIPFAVDNVVDRGSLDENLPLQTNDTVVVP
jgi:polysaccharide biosynthesis/export protein